MKIPIGIKQALIMKILNYQKDPEKFQNSDKVEIIFKERETYDWIVEPIVECIKDARAKCGDNFKLNS